MIRTAKVESKVETREAKKRWSAPQVTRLEFPKTAAQTGFTATPDLLYNFLAHS